MDLDTWTRFLGLCTLINAVLLTFWALLLKLAPDLLYRTQKGWIDLPRQTVLTVLYGFLAVYKIFFMMFNLVPFVALLIG